MSYEQRIRTCALLGHQLVMWTSVHLWLCTFCCHTFETLPAARSAS